jgi:hypothetical protein
LRIFVQALIDWLASCYPSQVLHPRKEWGPRLGAYAIPHRRQACIGICELGPVPRCDAELVEPRDPVSLSIEIGRDTQRIRRCCLDPPVWPFSSEDTHRHLTGNSEARVVMVAASGNL